MATLTRVGMKSQVVVAPSNVNCVQILNHAKYEHHALEEQLGR